VEELSRPRHRHRGRGTDNGEGVGGPLILRGSRW
jgi:hypothetical protein